LLKMGDVGIIEDSKTEINDLCEEVTKGIEDLKRAKKLVGSARADKIAFLKNRLGRAKQALRTMKVELREMPKLQAKPHTEKAAQLEEKINQIGSDLDWLEKSDPNEELANQAKATDYKAVLDEGRVIQEDDLNRLHGITQTIAKTQEIGSETLSTMQKQREQIVNIDRGVDEVSSNIKLANRQLRVFVRRMATDKIIMGFLFLIFVGVVFIIIWKKVKH